MITYFESNSSIEASGRGLITEGTSTSVSFLWNLWATLQRILLFAKSLFQRNLQVTKFNPVAQKSELTKLEIALIVICAASVVVNIALSIKIMKKPQHSFEVIQ
jgi:hypothetical protein